MKVLIINTVRFRLNGITSVIMNYYRKMDKSDMKIDFVVINEISNEYRKELHNNNSDIYYISRKKNPIMYIVKLCKLLRKNKYDIVHIHGNSAIMSIETVAAYFAKIPVRIIHSHNTTCSHKKLHNLLYPILKRTYTHGFACGEAAGRWLFRDKKYELIKNGIDLSNFNYNERVRNIYRDKINVGERKVIGHIGNFVYQKNHIFIIDIFYELLKVDKNYVLLLISDGELLDDIKFKVKNLGIDNSVIFLGKTNEVSGYLEAMDIFVLPSHYEGLPVVLIEAQALGLPCLVSENVSRESKVTDLIEFISIDDTKIWVKKIIGQDINNRNERTEICHQYIEEAGYNVSKNANYMKELYNKYLIEVRENIKR